MPNPPPMWDQYYPGGVYQQAADWNVSQHNQIYQDPGTHAGPTGPAGPASNASGLASFRATLNNIDQNLGVTPPANTVVNFSALAFQQGAYFNASNHTWTPPAGIIYLYALCTAGNYGWSSPMSISIYKNGSPIVTKQE